MPFSKLQLKQLLVDSELIGADEFESAAVLAERRGESLEETLVERSLIPEDYLGQLEADKLGVPFVRLENVQIPDHLLHLVPERVARYSHALAFGLDERGRVLLAMRDPQDLELQRLIEKKAGVAAVPHLVTWTSLRHGLERYTRDLESAIRKVIEDSGGVTAAEQAEDGESPVIRIVELLVEYAYQNNASDVHVEPRERDSVVRYRIDGILHDVVNLPIELAGPIITRIKILSKMRTDEHFASQDGKFQEVINGERVDVRVSVMPVMGGEKAVMRVLSERGKQYGLSDLGLSESDMVKINRHMRKSYGMILATGPTGSGKTTTLYSVLKVINTRDVNIATIEDPIEYAIDGVSQIQVNPKTGLTFASGLRSIVRQDPDIVMVGEIRDEETASIAVNAAMTGHLVLSTLHTNDAATTLPRFRDMSIEPFLIASTINIIIAQRLVRKICSRCITTYELKRIDVEGRMSSDVLRLLFPKKGAEVVQVYRGKGCDRCSRTGYQGRIGIYEALELDDKIRELIMSDANAKVIKTAAVDAGMTTMLEDGVGKVLTGITTIEEILRVAGE